MEALVVRVSVSVRGAPENLCQEALRGAFEEICKRVAVWREPGSVTVPEGFEQKAGASIAMPALPEGVFARSIRKLAVRRGNGFLRFGCGLCASRDDMTIHDLVGILQEGDKVTWETVCVPVGCCDIPMRVQEAAGTPAVALASFRLLSMPHARWTDLNAAAAKQQEWLGHLNTLIRMDLTGGNGEIAMSARDFPDE